MSSISPHFLLIGNCYFKSIICSAAASVHFHYSSVHRPFRNHPRRSPPTLSRILSYNHLLVIPFSDRAHVFLGQSSDPARLRDVTAFNANAISSQSHSLGVAILKYLFLLSFSVLSPSLSVTRGCSPYFKKILRQSTMGIMREARARGLALQVGVGGIEKKIAKGI